MKRGYWEPSEDKRLRRLWQVGEKTEVIARLMDRKLNSVLSRINILNLPRRYGEGPRASDGRCLHVRVSPSLWEAVRSEAERLEISPNAVIRGVLVEALGGED